MCHRPKQVGPITILHRKLGRKQCGRGYSVGNEGMYEHGYGARIRTETGRVRMAFKR